MSYLKRPIEERIGFRPILFISGILFMFCFLVTPVLAAAVDAVNGSGDGSTTQALLMVVLGAVAVAAVIVAGLVHWGRKEDHLDEMVHFCLKFLIHSEYETERCA